jgi:hypothetical protein
VEIKEQLERQNVEEQQKFEEEYEELGKYIICIPIITSEITITIYIYIYIYISVFLTCTGKYIKEQNDALEASLRKERKADEVN